MADFSEIERDLKEAGYGEKERAEYFRSHGVDIGAQIEEPPVMAQVGRGAMDIAQGLKQMYLSGMEAMNLEPEGTAAGYTQQVNDENALYERGRGTDDTDWARMGGQMAAMSPLGFGATTIPRAAGLGGVAGGSMYSPEGAGSMDKLMQTGLGIAGGAIGQAAAPYIGALAGNASQRVSNFFRGIGQKLSPARAEEIQQATVSALREARIDPNEITEAMADRIEGRVQDALNSGGGVDPRAAGRKAIFEELGFSGNAAPTEAQLSRKAAQWRDERELSKLDGGEALQQRYIIQSERFREITDELSDSIGGKASDDIAAAQGSFDDVRNQWNQSQTLVSEEYAKARLKAPDATATLDTFKATLDDLIELGEDSVSPQVTAAATMLRNKGITQVGEDVVLKDLNMQQVENMRKTLSNRLGDAIKSHDPNAVRVVNKLIQALDNDIAGAGDVFDKARNAARERFNRFGNKTIGSITNETANETNFIRNKIISGKPDDISSVRDMHLGGNPQVWADIKGQVYEHLMDKAFQGNAGSESGMFSGKMLGKALNRMGESRLKEIFTPDELSQIRLMAKAGEWMMSDVPLSGVNTSNTASTVIRAVQGATPVVSDIMNAGKAGLNRGRANSAMNNVPRMQSNGSQMWQKLVSDRMGKGRWGKLLQGGVPAIPAGQYAIQGER